MRASAEHKPLNLNFKVLPAAPTPSTSELIPPESQDSLIADLEKPTAILLRTCDKFHNQCITGGLRIAGRLMLIKQNSSDNFILMPNNHSVVVEDKDNGFYEVHRVDTDMGMGMGMEWAWSHVYMP